MFCSTYRQRVFCLYNKWNYSKAFRFHFNIEYWKKDLFHYKAIEVIILTAIIARVSFVERTFDPWLGYRKQAQKFLGFGSWGFLSRFLFIFFWLLVWIKIFRFLNGLFLSSIFDQRSSKEQCDSKKTRQKGLQTNCFPMLSMLYH